MGISAYHNIDCMNPVNGMPAYPDKHFDWVFADPNYGIGEHGGKDRSSNVKQRNGSRIHVAGNKYAKKSWDSEPCRPEVLDEIVRVSKNQIIWGINHYDWKPPGSGRIVWDKCNDGSDQSDCEIAYCSAHDTVKIFRFMWRGFCQGKSVSEGTVQKGNKKLNQARINPCEKPFELYRWKCMKYLKPGDTILDPFVGSASSLVVFEEFGFEYTGFETDVDYYKSSSKRLEAFRAKPKLFTGTELFNTSTPDGPAQLNLF